MVHFFVSKITFCNLKKKCLSINENCGDIIINKDGHKLSKQSRARALPKNNCAHVLIRALRDLGQDIPNSLVAEKLNYVWKWAIENWDVTKIPKYQTIPFILS